MRRWSCLAAVLIVAACGAEDRHPPLPLGEAGSGASGSAGDDGMGGAGAAKPSGGGQAGASLAGAGGSAGVANEAGQVGSSEAGAASGGGPGSDSEQFPCPATSAPNRASVCDPRLAFGSSAAVPVDAGNAARLIGVTPDELTIAWSAFGSSSLRFFIADRASADESFGPVQQVSSLDAVVGMSPDGLRLITLSTDGTTYRELAREERGFDFGEPSDAAFASLNQAAVAGDTIYSDCVISADDRTLIYTAQTDDEQEYSMKISTREADEPWPPGNSLMHCELQRHGTLLRRPTSLSADGLTLFYYDPDRRRTRAAFRATPSASFDFFADMELAGPVSVNAACTVLYASPLSGSSHLSLRARE